MSSLSSAFDALQEMGPEGIARFAESLEPAWLEEALHATGTATMRRRKLPAEQAIWLVLGMGLFADRSIREVVEHLGLVLPGVKSLAPSAIPQARYRLGAEPMKQLFHRVAEAWSNPQDRAGYRGLSVFAVDGTCTRVQDSNANLVHFGKPGGRSGSGDAGYPQLRLVALFNVDSRMLVDAVFGPYASYEQALAKGLWAQVPDHSLTLVDKGFSSYALFSELAHRGTDRHFLIRMKKNARFEPIEVLADGTWLANIKRPKHLGSGSELPSQLTVRIIEYQYDGGQAQRLMTTLLDPASYPASEIIEMYHQRWEAEIAFDEIKTHMLERKECLRSLRPEGVEQEVWGLLLVYNLVRREMLLAAEQHQLPANRISFRSSLLWIRNFWLTAWRTKPGNLPKHLGRFRSTLDVLLLPERRRQRKYPRHVKIKMSNYPRNRGKRSARVAN